MDLRIRPSLVLLSAVLVLAAACGGTDPDGPRGGVCASDHCPQQPPGCRPNLPGCPGSAPDASGLWHVEHVFALEGALPAALSGVFAALRVIDQTLSGALGLPPWLQSALDGIVAQYVPGWVRIAIRIGDTLGSLLSHLRSGGALRLVRADGVDPRRLTGTEVWTGLAFYFLPQCCPGGPLGGSCPALRGDPFEPLACARIDVPTAAFAAAPGFAQCRGQPVPAVQVEARSFQATVSGSGPARDRAPWTLSVGPREVGLRMGAVVAAVIDALLGRFTPWHCIAEATDCAPGAPCIVDCPNLARSLSRLSGGTLGVAGLEQICGGAVALLGRQMSQALERTSFEADALTFSGHARISGFAGDGAGAVAPDESTCDSRQLCANQLGSDDFDRQTRADARQHTSARDGSWEGSFFRRTPSHMPGGWEAKRWPPR
jgi:hypothetical protein